MQIPWLLRIPSWLFGLVYLIMIPAFAGIYQTFAKEFFHTTAQHEEYLKADESEILAELRQSMISRFVETYGSRSLPESPLLNWDYIYLYDLQYEKGDYSFVLQADFKGHVDRIPPRAPRMRLTLLWPRTSSDNKVRMYPLNEEPEIKGDFMRKMFPIDQRVGEEYQSDNVGFVTVSDSLERKLIAWGEAQKGFPAQSTGTFWRLLYFSATTITTVGYGDILPITTRARLWVGSESVLGIIVIGLFLNSLALKIQEKESLDKS